MRPSATADLLVRRKAATAAMVTVARAEAATHGERLCSRLLAMGVDEGKLAAVLAERHGLPGVDLSRSVIPLSILDDIPLEVAQADLVLPLSVEGRRLHLAMGSAGDAKVLDEVRFVTGKELSIYLALRTPLQRAIRDAYQARQEGQATWSGAAATAQTPHLARALPPGQRAPLLTPVGEPSTGEDDLVFVPVPTPARAARPDGKRLVLVVDDEPTVLLLASRAVEKRGFAVERAVDGAEALEKAARLLPDLILLDAMLPKVHGFEVCMRLRADALTRRIPVIIMTAVYRGWRFAQDARETFGAEDYVEKPFHVDDLQRRVEAVLTRSAATAPSPEFEAWFRRGRDLYYAGKAGEAAEALQAAVTLDPWSPEANAALGLALRGAGDLFGAMTALERAVDMRPGLVKTVRALASLYLDRGFRRKAEETLQRGLANAPSAQRGALQGDLDALRDEAVRQEGPADPFAVHP
jgi:DNA-binding response OmpR family regulator/Fe2+ transport system protein FeoA